MNIYENKYSFSSIYSFNLIKVQTDLQLWNNKNRVKRTLNFGITKIGSNELRFGRFKSQNAHLEVL
jgi:hypothetical protein